MKCISAYKGTAPICIPDHWLDTFNPNTAFAAENHRAQIRFTPTLAFEIWTEQHGPHPIARARALTPTEIEQIQWGPLQPPWEPWTVAQAFGHGPLLYLHHLVTAHGTPDYAATL